MRLRTGLMATAIASLIGAASCAPVKILNSITPSGSFDKTKNISYGPLERQKLDIYRSETSRADRPVLVFIHGGSWDHGSKDLYKFLAEGFTSEGFDVVVPNYRLYPDVIYPKMIEDSAQAVEYAVKQFPDREIVLMGHSAGAYNMLMVGLAPNYLKAAGGDLCRDISGLVSLAGPTGAIKLKEEPYISIFPDRFHSNDAPINNLIGPRPPLFLAHGSEDETVHPRNSEDLADKIIEQGGVATAKIYEGKNHTDMVKHISGLFDGDSTLKGDIIQFIENLPEKREGSYCQ